MRLPTFAIRPLCLPGLCLLAALCLCQPDGRAAETDAFIHDPSTVIQRDGEYWVYGTGRGILQLSSKDRLHWTRRGPVFRAPPAWTAVAVPANTRNFVWAPDVHLFGGTYYLYYSYSTMGSSTSAIGVATNDTLNPETWVDQGEVIHSTRAEGYNTIDPCIFADADGHPWLSFGSFFSGIKLIRLDPATGKQTDGHSEIFPIANRPQSPGNAIEASFIYYHDHYYYLFVSWDACCAGSKSTYNIRVGRSAAVTGPYLDKAGRNMNDGGGTLFLGSMPDDGTGRPFDDEVGPGHAGIFQDGDGYWFTCHYEWARDHHGASTLNVFKLAWDMDGWPRAILGPGPYKLVSNLLLHNAAQVTGGSKEPGAGLETGPFRDQGSQQWTLRYEGEGLYTILNTGSGLALSTAACATGPGARVELAPDTRQDCQRWYLQQKDNGTYLLLPKNGAQAAALTVADCSPFDGSRLQLWTNDGSNCEEWSLRSR